MNQQIRTIDDGITEIKSDTLDTERERLAHYDSIIRKLFYACECCNGALIHLANCIGCRRATIRKCTHCGKELRITHAMCETSCGYENHNVNSASEAEKR